MHRLTGFRAAGVLLTVAAILIVGIFSSTQAAAPPAPERFFGALPSLVIYAREVPGGSTHKVLPEPIQRANAPEAAQKAIIHVNYAGTWDASARTAFDYAAQLWSNALTSAVPIEVQAQWVALPAGVLGGTSAAGAYKGFQGATMANTWFPNALANKLANRDLDPTNYDIDARFNSSFSAWYFGTDGHPSGQQYDFVSVVLHELAHGLGFYGSFEVAGTSGGWGAAGLPFIYDQFVANGSNQMLVNTGIFQNPSSALGAQLTSNNVFFSGQHAKAAYQGRPVPLYAPGSWAQGSSISHLGETFNNTANGLMTFAISNGEALHSPGPITLGILQDIGWSIPSVLPPTPTPTGAPAQVAKYHYFLPGILKHARP